MPAVPDATVPHAIPERQPVAVTDIPIAVGATRPDGTPPDTWRKTIVDPATGHAVFYVRFGPHQRGEAHWHTSDTVYMFVKGSFSIEGETTYRAGDVRRVRGGFAYGAETAGAEGCEFYFVSLGPFGRLDPDVDPPPLGRWDDALPGGPNRP
jgi:hypothetical protein